MTIHASTRVALTLLVRDEADIIGENIAFHRARGVDVIIVTDNASSDGTLEILKGHAERGEIVLLREPSDAYRQDEWATRMAIMAREDFGADWVLSGDADEFWFNPEGTLAEALSGRTEDILRCDLRNLFACREDLQKDHWSKTLRFRAAAPEPLSYPRNLLEDPLPAPYFYLRLSNKNAFSTRGLSKIERGAHAAVYEGGDPAIGRCPIRIYHFPVRTRTEFARSVARIGGVVRATPDLPPAVSWKYRRWIAMTERTGGIDAAFAEALPDAGRLARDLAAGTVVCDTTIRDMMDRDQEVRDRPGQNPRSRPEPPAAPGPPPPRGANSPDPVGGHAADMERGDAGRRDFPGDDHWRIIAASSLFDAGWYMKNCPCAGSSPLSPAEHFLLHGAKLGFDPGPRFCCRQYELEYPDVLLARFNPLLHYILHGRSEGRNIYPSKVRSSVD